MQIYFEVRHKTKQQAIKSNNTGSFQFNSSLFHHNALEFVQVG